MTVTPADTRRENGGILVERAAAVLPATTTTAAFTIVGTVEITRLYGVCTTVCSGTATNLSIVHVPTSGTNLTIASTLAITSFAAGTYVISELDGTALVGVTAVTGAVGLTARSLLGAGSISLTTSATNTGAFRWVCQYVPVESGSYVVAA
jgi:hypothetical protein